MLTKNDLNDIEDWILNAFTLKQCKNFESVKFKARMEGKYGLKLISSDGISRTVYKKPYSNEVVKFTYFVHNIAEDAAWNFYKGSGIQDSLAECYDISKGGMVLAQEFMSHGMPGNRCYKFPYDSFYSSQDWIRLRELVESVFEMGAHAGLYASDFHESNLMYNSRGEVKIIDYASIAENFTQSYFLTFTKTNASRIRSEMMAKLRKEDISDKYLSMSINSRILEVESHLGDSVVDIDNCLAELKSYSA